MATLKTGDSGRGIEAEIKAPEAGDGGATGSDGNVEFGLREPSRNPVFKVDAVQAACFLGLVELGPGRVAYPFDLWRDMIDVHGLNPDAWPSLCKSVPIPVPRRFVTAA